MHTVEVVDQIALLDDSGLRRQRQARLLLVRTKPIDEKQNKT
jgi:hypothetical protein